MGRGTEPVTQAQAAVDLHVCTQRTCACPQIAPSNVAAGWRLGYVCALALDVPFSFLSLSPAFVFLRPFFCAAFFFHSCLSLPSTSCPRFSPPFIHSFLPPSFICLEQIFKSINPLLRRARTRAASEPAHVEGPGFQ